MHKKQEYLLKLYSLRTNLLIVIFGCSILATLNVKNAVISLILFITIIATLITFVITSGVIVEVENIDDM